MSKFTKYKKNNINELKSQSVNRHFKLLDFVHNFVHINAIAVSHLSMIAISTLKH